LKIEDKGQTRRIEELQPAWLDAKTPLVVVLS
jgi:hypothetical protein